MKNNILNQIYIWLDYMKTLIIPSVYSTLKIVFFTVVLGYSFGFILSILLITYSENGLKPNKKIYKFLDSFINIIRSLPTLILIVAILPLTRLIIGTSIGTKAAILPLSISATAFIGRMLENIFREVDDDLIEAAKSFGASHFDIIFRVMVKESIPEMISLLTLAIINNIGASTIAGAIGGGGLGAIAINYGYQSFNNMILYTCVIIFFILVQCTQMLGHYFYKKSL